MRDPTGDSLLSGPPPPSRWRSLTYRTSTRRQAASSGTAGPGLTKKSHPRLHATWCFPDRGRVANHEVDEGRNTMAETPTTELVGCEVVSVRDEKVGRIDELFVYGDGGEEGWALVKIGLLGMKTALVP